MPAVSPPSKAGIPPGSLEVVLDLLAHDAAPQRRRSLLEGLERKGHRLSLAGLNRILDYARRAGLTDESPDGVRLRKQPPGPA